MQKFGKSLPVRRVEDNRFLTGRGRYLEDAAPADALKAYVLRAPVAHAAITALELEDARAADGVHLVMGGADLIAAGITEGLPGEVAENRDGTSGASPPRPLLATGRVRFVGEPVALVVAETLAQARDTAEMIVFDYDDLPAQMALGPGDVALHDEAPGNLACDWATGDRSAVETAISEAAHVVRMQVADNRVIVNTMEPRGCFAEPEGDRLHISLGAQGVWGTKANAARILGIEPELIRVSIPDVGGGFGMKGMTYPETFLVAYAVRALGRAVCWMSDRSEAMQSDTGARDLVHDAVLAFDANHRITAYRVETDCNIGAYNSDMGQLIQSEYFAMALTGAFDLKNIWLNVRGYFTNTAPTDAYRGAGRAEANYLLQRIMDKAARELGVDLFDLHRKNFILPDQLPYLTATEALMDAADYGRVLNRAGDVADRAGFAARRAGSARRGRLRGLGLGFYVIIAVGSDAADITLRYTDDGMVELAVVGQSSGQGHETVFARFLSDMSGLPQDRVRVVQGDSDALAEGADTGGSSTVNMVTNATLTLTRNVVARMGAYLAGVFGADPDAVTFDGERFAIPGSNRTPDLLEAFEMARTEGRDDLTVYHDQGKLSQWGFPNGAHLAEVEIDPETGHVVLERYTAVDDFGNLINPLLVEGQVHGGAAQGIGQALCEHVVFDADGQLLTASFMDYALPRADDIPMFTFVSEPEPSAANPMGMKGCGEASTAGAMAATANAVADALWSAGVRQADMPFTPHRVWKMLKDGELAQMD